MIEKCDICDTKCELNFSKCNQCFVHFHNYCLELYTGKSANDSICEKCLKLQSKPQSCVKYFCKCCNDPTGLIIKKKKFSSPNVSYFNSDSTFHVACFLSCNVIMKSFDQQIESCKCQLCDLKIDFFSLNCASIGCRIKVHARCAQWSKRMTSCKNCFKINQNQTITYYCEKHCVHKLDKKILDGFRDKIVPIFQNIARFKSFLNENLKGHGSSTLKLFPV